MPRQRSKKPAASRPNKPDNTPGLAARRAAADTLYDCLEKGLDFDRAFDSHARALGANDRAFARMMVLTTMRRLGSLRTRLEHLMRDPFSVGAERVEYAILVGLAQLLILDVDAHAAVDLAVRDVKSLQGPRHKLFSLVNAVLRRVEREKDTQRDALKADPLDDLPAFVRMRWRDQFNEDDLKAMARTLRDQPMLDVTVKSDPDKWAKVLDADPLPTGTLRLAGGSVTDLPGFDDGAWWVQDVAAALPARLLGDVDGLNVLDLCAAPGGKTMQLAAAGATVTALDRSKPRLKLLAANLERTGLAATLIESVAEDYTPDTLFDALLLDAPCSATGTFRRNPDGLWRKSAGDIAKLSALQGKLIQKSASLLKSGGLLVYCVCSMEYAEGEGQLTALKDAGLSLVPVEPDEIPGFEEAILPDGTVRTHPAQEMGGDGFFMARFRKGSS